MKTQLKRVSITTSCQYCPKGKEQRAIWVRISPKGKQSHFCGGCWKAFRYRSWKRVTPEAVVVAPVLPSPKPQPVQQKQRERFDWGKAAAGDRS